MMSEVYMTLCIVFYYNYNYLKITCMHLESFMYTVWHMHIFIYILIDYTPVLHAVKCITEIMISRFPLENLGVAPVLRRSSSQTLYLCVGVKRGVSSTRR